MFFGVVDWRVNIAVHEAFAGKKKNRSVAERDTVTRFRVCVIIIIIITAEYVHDSRCRVRFKNVITYIVRLRRLPSSFKRFGLT